MSRQKSNKYLLKKHYQLAYNYAIKILKMGMWSKTIPYVCHLMNHVLVIETATLLYLDSVNCDLHCKATCIAEIS